MSEKFTPKTEQVHTFEAKELNDAQKPLEVQQKEAKFAEKAKILQQKWEAELPLGDFDDVFPVSFQTELYSAAVGLEEVKTAYFNWGFRIEVEMNDDRTTDEEKKALKTEKAFLETFEREFFQSEDVKLVDNLTKRVNFISFKKGLEPQANVLVDFLRSNVVTSEETMFVSKIYKQYVKEIAYYKKQLGTFDPIMMPLKPDFLISDANLRLIEQKMQMNPPAAQAIPDDAWKNE